MLITELCPVLCCATLLVSVATSFAAPRTYTDSASGRTITADLLNVTGDSVTLKLESGAVHTLPLSRLSDSDRAHISNWVKSNPAGQAPSVAPEIAAAPIRYGFNVTWKKEKTGEKATNLGPYKGAEEQWTCRFTVTNLSSQSLEDVEVRYQVHASIERDRTPTDEHMDGADQIASLPRNQPVQISAKPVPLLRVKLDSGYITTDGSRGNKRDSLKGVAVGVYHKGVLVHEFRSPGVPKTPFGKPENGKPR
jgi:hypothetical protein